MNNACPNPNSPEWKELVKALGGEADALTAFVQNNGEVPTIEKAKEILANQKALEKDEQISRSSDAFKLKRATQQRTMLETVSTRANKAQLETLNNLIKMNMEYQRFLNNNLESVRNGQAADVTISVSNFIGSSDFKGDASIYVAFQRFGTFMHEVLELAQVDALKSEKTIGEIFTREFFDKRYEEYTKKYPFEIKNFTIDEMFLKAKSIIDAINVKNFEKYMILPEITVVGRAANGKKIIGRVDLMLIDPEGKIEIYDFKTKKTSGLVSKDKDGVVTTDTDSAIVHLADTEFTMDYGKSGVARSFLEIDDGKRTAFDTWTLQLDLYDQILRQNGMTVTKKQIAALMYQTDREDLSFLGAALHIFTNQNYYDQARNVNVDTQGFWFDEPSKVTRRIDALKRTLKKEVPVEGDIVEEEEVTAKPAEETLQFKPSKESLENFNESLRILVDGQITAINEKIAELKNSEKPNPELLKILEIRKNSLISFAKIVKANKDKPGNALLHSSNFFLATDQISVDLNDITGITEESLKRYREKKEFKASLNELKQISAAFQRSSALVSLIQLLEEIVNDAATNPENKITKDSPIMIKLAGMRANSAKIEAAFREISLAASIDILKETGEQTFEGVNKEMEQTLSLQLTKLNEELEALKKGEGLSAMKTIGSSLLCFFSKEHREKLEKEMGPENSAVLNRIATLEKEIKVVEAKLAGYKFDDATLEKYITGISNPESLIYMGSQAWNPDSLLSSLSMDQFIASASNSDLGIASFAMMLKNAEAMAAYNLQSDEEVINFDRLRVSLVDKYGIDKLNDMIAEWRQVTYQNPKTGAADTKSMYYLTKPYTEEYEKTYKEYSLKLRAINKEIDLLRADVNSKTNTPEYDAAKKLYLDKVAERDRLKDENIKWMVENCNLPYIDDFYELQKQLPEPIREKLQLLYFESETIRSSVARGDEISLEESDFERLHEIDVEIKKLRNEAKELDPKYAEYLDKINDLFEYEPDEKYFKILEENAKIRYADDPVSLKKWYEENQVTRPNSKWYERLEELYDLRSNFLDENEELSDLYAERSKIINPYKQGGRLNPKFFTEEDIKRIEEIEAQIEDIIEDLKKDKSNPPSKELREINKEISSIRSRQISPVYKKEFDNRTAVLMGKMKIYRELERRIAEAESKGDKKLAEELTKEYTFELDQFTSYEKDYEKYYNKTHVNKYRSVTTGYDITHFAVPRSFNYETVPSATVRDLYMETIPNPKYYKMRKVREKRWYLDGKILSTKEVESMDEVTQNYYESNGRLVKRPGGYNPDFIKSPDGVPLPRAVFVDTDGNFKIKSGFENSKNINPKYLEIMANPEIAQFYEATVKMFFNKQRQIEGRKNGWQLPGFASTAVENISREGFVKSFERGWQKFKDRNLKLKGEQDLADNIFGDAGSRIRMRFTQQLSEELQSKDAVGCIMKYVTEAHSNMALQDVAPKADAMIEYLKLQRKDIEQKILSGPTYITENGKRVEVNMKDRLDQLNKVIDMLEFEKRKLISGQLETNKDRALKKVMGQVFAYTSFIRIGFDITNQVKNYVSGNVQAFIAASGYDSDNYTRENWLYAKGRVYSHDGFLANYFRDYGKISDLNESTMLYRLMNPLQKDKMKYYADSSGGGKRRMAEKFSSIGELSHLLQDKGDTEIGVTVMYAVMDHYRFVELEKGPNGDMIPKVDANGNEVRIPAHQCYIKGKNGELVRRTDVLYTVDDEKRLRGKIYSEMRRAQGNYAAADMTKAQETVVGKMAFFFKKFLVPALLNRFGYLRPNWEAGEMSIGFWRAMSHAVKYFGPGATLKEFLIGSKMLKKMNMEGVTTIKVKDPATGKMVTKEVGDFYARKIAHARRDMVAIGLLTIMGMLIKAYVQGKDDDDDQLGMLEGNAYRVIWGVQAETASMMPVGGGSQEYIKNFTTAIPFVRELTQMTKFSNHLIKYGMAMTLNGGTEPDPDYDSAFYQEVYKDAFFQRKSGAYQEGDAKIMKDFIDLTGIKNFRDLLDPNYRIDIMKRNQ